MRKPIMPETAFRLHNGCYFARNASLCGLRSSILFPCVFLYCITSLHGPVSHHVGAQSPFECGVNFPGSEIAMAGSWVVAPIATLWAESYRQACRKAGAIDIETSGNDDGMRRLCSAATGQRSADIAMLSRTVLSEEAQLQVDGAYRCNIGDTRRTFVQLDVALDGLAVVTLTGDSADLCIRQLGGLTRDQLRWMFSSYSESRLLASGWDAASISNSDGNPDTRLWCELLNHPTCPCSEIRLAGSPNGTQPHQYMGQFTFRDYDIGETFDLPRYFNSTSDFDIVRYLDDTGGSAIAYLRVPDFESNANVLSAAPILGTSGIYIPPSGSTLQSGEYTYSRRVYMNVIVSDAVSYRATHPFLRFGYTQLGSALVKSVDLVPIPDDEIPKMLALLAEPPVLCFSGHNTVVVRGKGTIPIEELQLDDYVHVGKGSYSKVISFGHLLRDGVGTFLRIESQHRRIEISPLHLLYVGGQLRAAKDTAVGDLLDDNDRILSITTVRHRGIYAPLTESGRIAVSGVFASSYVALWTIPPPLMHSVSHLALAPLRICKALRMNHCMGESYNDIGVATQYVYPIQALDWATRSSISIQLAAVVCVSPLLFLFWLFESSLSVSWVVLPVLYGCYWIRRTKGKRPEKSISNTRRN